MRSAATVAALLVLAACSGSDEDAGPTTSAPATAATTASSPRTTDQDAAGAPTTSTATETTALRPGVVAFDGSVESLVLALPDARNFADGVEEWLAAVPGQEGVLRNSRGITVFVPADEGFTASAKAARFADPDTAAATIGDHLLVGALDDLTELDGSVVVASGLEYRIAENGGTIGGRRVLRTETGTNGVVFVLDGPLGADD